ncbi:Transposase IS4 [Popillia japonica]|uniref:Transposase IS4 n=1 Tax=Popillia japonica TaxID=7064 RepID=A0AAW1L6I5_POPJA
MRSWKPSEEGVNSGNIYRLKNLTIDEKLEAFRGRCKFRQYLPSKPAKPGENLTIDEKLEAFRGRCKFRQYLPSKPAKCEIKIFALVDAKLFYIYNLEIYTGKQPVPRNAKLFYIYNLEIYTGKQPVPRNRATNQLM